jgi:hypothetical protein
VITLGQMEADNINRMITITSYFYIVIQLNFILFQYLAKQTSVLREVNDSRLKIYEQLEVSISDLEVANKKLQDENSADKAMIKM